MLVSELVEKLMKEDPFAEVVVEDSDHSFRSANMEVGEAEDSGDWLHEYHGPENMMDPENGQVINVVIFS